MASVVLRTSTTWSSGRAPTNVATSPRVDSNASVANRDLSPVPRWTLLYLGTKASTACQTSGSAGVLAA